LSIAKIIKMPKKKITLEKLAQITANGFIDLKTELKGDISELRTELKGDISELRTELKGDISELRTELKGDISELHKDIGNIERILRAEVDRDDQQGQRIKRIEKKVGLFE